jgi:uncharacterized protein YbbC (DUF1343 family)
MIFAGAEKDHSFKHIFFKSMPPKLLPGVDSFLTQHDRYLNQRLALVTNNAATDAGGTLVRVAMLNNHFQLTKLFSPEHGITVKGDDGVRQHGGTDMVTGLPVISLFGEQLAPEVNDLEDVDLVLFDIPDVGCRFYTYLWTMTHVMEACARAGKPFIVLDRPNPIGALLENTEGPMLDEAHCSSFIGRWNIPLKHSCTLGELALYFAATRMHNLKIDVVKASGYHRDLTGLDAFPFVPTSPAIQDIHTAMLYPGTGLLEGMLVNEGRGTAHPFTLFGAPWMQADVLCSSLQAVLKFVKVEPVHYVPSAGVYAHETCHGVSLRITDPLNFKAVSSGIVVLQTILRIYPEIVQERLYVTNANPTGERHMDKLLGYKNAFATLRDYESPDLDVAGEWSRTMAPYLLYS